METSISRTLTFILEGGGETLKHLYLQLESGNVFLGNVLFSGETEKVPTDFRITDKTIPLHAKVVTEVYKKMVATCKKAKRSLFTTPVHIAEICADSEETMKAGIFF